GRWHITPMRWLRAYISIPLGGNRRGPAATYRNVMLTLVAGGLWHGGAWHFVVWGVYHGALLSLHRAFGRGRERPWLARPVSTALTYLAVCVGWILFRSTSLPLAATMVSRLVVPGGGTTLAAPDQTIVLMMLATAFAGHALGAVVDADVVARRVPAPLAGAAIGLAIVAV